MKESPIFSKTHDMLLWLLPQATKFPRIHRFGLGERVIRQALDFQELLVAASIWKGDDKIIQLKKADITLVQLRQSIRLCKDLQLMSLSQYEHVSIQLVEIGKLLGGWISKTGQVVQ